MVNLRWRRYLGGGGYSGLVICRGWVERDYQKPCFGERWMGVSEDKVGRQRLGRMVCMTISSSLVWLCIGAGCARIERSGESPSSQLKEGQQRESCDPKVWELRTD